MAHAEFKPGSAVRGEPGDKIISWQSFLIGIYFVQPGIPLQVRSLEVLRSCSGLTLLTNLCWTA